MAGNPTRDFRATQEAFTRYVRDPQTNPPPPGSRPERMAWYAKLFFNNIDGTLENAFPALRASLGESDWNALVRPFFRDHPARSPILRDLPAAFLDYLQETDSLSEWQRELAAYELARFDLIAEDAEPAPDDLDPAGDLLSGRPVVSSLVRLMMAAYPVDRLAAALEAGEPVDVPPAGLHHLALHRDEQGAPFALNLTPASAQLLLALIESDDKGNSARIDGISGLRVCSQSRRRTEDGLVARRGTATPSAGKPASPVRAGLQGPICRVAALVKGDGPSRRTAPCIWALGGPAETSSNRAEFPKSGRDVIAELAEGLGRPVGELLDFAGAQLDQWRSQGILIGARPPR